jgi:hypothetical protein
MADRKPAQPDTETRELVILPARDISLPELLKHIEAGKIIIIIIPAPRTPPKPSRVLPNRPVTVHPATWR